MGRGFVALTDHKRLINVIICCFATATTQFKGGGVREVHGAVVEGTLAKENTETLNKLSLVPLSPPTNPARSVVG
jgi:hypothetical protein